MSQQKGISFKEFRQRFQTEEACEAYLFEQRWPDGFICPKCGGTGCYQLRGRREYVCKHCHRQSSVTAGTVLHRTHLPLTIWFWTIYLAAHDKRGISAMQLSSELEIAYSSAWYLVHRLRKAMGQRDQDYVLSGIVELDDAYFSAPKSTGKRGRGTEKTSALAAVSLSEQRHPKIFIIQAFLQGTYHGPGKKYLQSYFDEFCFRFNRRFWPRQLFPRLVCAVAASNILGYGDLTR